MCFPGRIAAKRYIIVSVSIFVLAMAFSATAGAGIIRTTISSHYTIAASGDIELRFKIKNQGNVTAHKMTATLKLGNVMRRFPDLGNNSPDGKTILKERMEIPGWKPGIYLGVMTVFFEEQDGKPHLADHFFTVRYGITDREKKAAPLNLRAGSLVFNPNAFWEREKPLNVTLKNDGDTTITPELCLYLPEGYTSSETAGKHSLPPGNKSVATLPVIRNGNAESGKVLHLIATYDFRGLHYTAILREVIRIEKKPVLFKVYVMGGGVVILMVWGFLVVFRVTSDE
jgi:hypothetical protein